MPHIITIARGKYKGEYTYYTQKEADSRNIYYHVPPFQHGCIPESGWVITSNNYVVPILNASDPDDDNQYYVTPFGKTRYNRLVFCDGLQRSRFINTAERADQKIDMYNMAHWHVRKGDASVAFRMAYGYEPPPDIQDTIRGAAYQRILQGEYERMADELGFPKDTIVQHRIKQTAAMTEVIEHIKSKILANETLDPSHIELFERCFKAQQDNVTDLEKGYVRTPPDTTPTAQIEAHYRATAAFPQGNFHMQPSSRIEDTMGEVPHAKLQHPDGFHDLEMNDPNNEEVQDAENETEEV